MANDNSNAAPVEAPRRDSQEAPSQVESASARGVSEAYQEMDRNSTSNNSFDNQRNNNGNGTNNLDAFGKANNGLEAVGVASDTPSTRPGDAGNTGRVGPEGQGRQNPEGREKGADWMYAHDDNSFSATYKPEQRNDRRATLDENPTEGGGLHRVETFKGRNDGKTRQETTETGTAYEGTREFDSSVRADGLQRESVSGNTATAEHNRSREFDPNKNPQHMSGEVVSTKDGVTTADRNFQGRQDGMLHETSVKGPNGEQITQNFKDGGRVETSVGPDGARVTTAYDQSGKVLPNGRPETPKEGPAAADGATPPKGDKQDPKQQQIDEQLKKFEENLTKKNELPALRKGEGPYQALQRGIKEGTIEPMSPKELLTEARRIRDRDLVGDKKHYKVDEKIGRESKEEIGKKVETERQRLKGEGGSEATPPRPPQELAPTPAPEGERPPEGERAPEAERTPAPDTPEGRLKASRERLDKAAGENIKNPEERKTFNENMRKFEERAKKEGLSPDEVAKSYDSLTRMMTAPQGTDSKLPSAEQRAILAQNFMHHAADPTNIDQGRANTCNVTTMQERLMTKNPSKMADMLEQATTKGSYTAADGTQIKLDPNAMKPIRGLDGSTPKDATRSYGTQVLNHVMVNEISQRKNPPEFYTQLTNNRDENGEALGRNDSGERLRKGSFEGENIKDNSGRHQPNIDIGEMNESMKRYTGEKSTVAIEKTFGAEGDNMIKFGSPKELAEQIQKAQREGKMPLIIMVDGNDPAFTGGEGRSPEWGAHVVTIRGYNPETGQVDISNQWGKGNDRKMDINRLYEATKPPKPPEQQQHGGAKNMSYDMHPLDR